MVVYMVSSWGSGFTKCMICDLLTRHETSPIQTRPKILCGVLIIGLQAIV